MRRCLEIISLRVNSLLFYWQQAETFMQLKIVGLGKERKWRARDWRKVAQASCDNHVWTFAYLDIVLVHGLFQRWMSLQLSLRKYMRRVINNLSHWTTVLTAAIWQSWIHKFYRGYIIVLWNLYLFLPITANAVVFKVSKWSLFRSAFDLWDLISTKQFLRSRCSWLLNLELVHSHALFWLSNVLGVRMQLRSRWVETATGWNRNWHPPDSRVLFRGLGLPTHFLNYKMVHLVFIELHALVWVTSLLLFFVLK